MIYIVDDDESVGLSLRRLLKSERLPVKLFDSAAGLLESVHPQVDDCLILDIQMPYMNGLELLQELRARDCRAKVIFITAYDDESMRHDACQQGVVGYLNKPFDCDELLDMVNLVLTGAEK